MKRLVMSVFLLLFVCGCSSNKDISYEEMFTKMVANAPSEYEEAYKKETKESQKEIVSYLEDEYNEYIDSDTLDELINTQIVNSFYDYSLTNEVEISLKDTEITEKSDNHYTFTVTYTVDDTEESYQGNFQTNDEGLINYFRVTSSNLQ